MKSAHPLQSVQDTLDTAQAARAALDHHAALLEEWQARETELLTALNIEDDAALLPVVQLRARIDLLPRKVAIMEADYLLKKQLLLATLRSGIEELESLKAEKSTALKKTLRQHLAPALSADDNLERTVEEAYLKNAQGVALHQSGMSYEYSVGLTDPDKAEADAAKLLRMYAETQAVQIPENL